MLVAPGFEMWRAAQRPPRGARLRGILSRVRRLLPACLLVGLVACSEDNREVNIELTAYPVRVMADDRDAATLTATVRETDGRPRANAPVSITVQGTDGSQDIITGFTDEEGVFVTRIRSRIGGMKTATATTATESVERSVAFTPLPPCPGVPRVGSVPELPVAPSAIGDFDEDGTVDVAAVDLMGKAQLLLGNGDGTFARPLLLLDESVDGILHAADLDGDGHLDLLLSSFSHNRLVVLKGAGDGTTQLSGELPLSGYAMSMTVADFDGDGHDDIAAGVFDLHALPVALGIDVLFGLGDGNFTPYTHLPRVLQSDHLEYVVKAADVDGDALPDLLGWEHYGSVLTVSFSNSDRTFSTTTTTVSSRLYDSSVTAADVNGDERTDLLVDLYTELAVIRGRSDRVLEAEYSTWSPTQGHAASDLDGDGDIDLARSRDYLAGNGDGTFTQGAMYGSDISDSPSQIADLDGNGHLDIILGLRILLNDGEAFRGPSLYDTSATQLYAVGDVDNDGVPDIVHGDPTATRARIGNGDGTFREGVEVDHVEWLPVTGVPEGSGAQIADLDRDGNADIVTRSHDGLLSVQLGNGDGTFTPHAESSMLSGVEWHIVDLDADGKLDVASGTRVLRGLGNGGFTPLLDSNGDFYFWDRGTYAHVNSDDVLDLVSVIRHQGTSSSVGVHLGIGDGTFAAPVTIDTSLTDDALVAEDFNTDGFVDLVMLDENLVIYNGRGDGTFDAPSRFEASVAPAFAVDVDRDGMLDVVSETGALVRGDGNGKFEGALTYLRGGVPADLDADGRIDLINNDHVALQQGCSAE